MLEHYLIHGLIPLQHRPVAVTSIPYARSQEKTGTVLEKFLTRLVSNPARKVPRNGMHRARRARHPERVADFAAQIGRAMALSEAEIRLLKRGGLLHDIGKIGTPATILNKRARLSEEEFSEVKYHPEIGAKILGPIEVHPDILNIVLQHHERYDGNGYPHGLAGREISLQGRIAAVADVYDALSSARPYRIQWRKERVVDYILGHAGTHFDPAVIEAFKAIQDEIP